MSYYGNYDYNNNRGQFLSTAVPLGVVATGAHIATYALDKANRADTFVSVDTAKKCAKEFTKDGRDLLQKVLKKVKWDTAAEYVEKLSTKKAFAGIAGLAILGSATVMNLIGKCFRND